ncbi:MAG: hypothetical protein SFX18_11945 [Pirellulales bacterium]|nr:hypothetical protein [Pirellulales bacterium]
MYDQTNYQSDWGNVQLCSDSLLDQVLDYPLDIVRTTQKISQIELREPNLHVPPTFPHGCLTDDPNIKTCMEFLVALFMKDDLILIRPNETWEEGGKKQSKIDFKSVSHCRLDYSNMELCLIMLFPDTEKKMTNLYFGVCPRYGDKSQYDLAWQIRTVRTLWMDIDHITYGDALKAVNNAKLPPPSVAVNSGNGVHFYWLLDEPYLIDDAGPPPAVLKGWNRGPQGNKPFQYIVEDGEKILLKSRPNLTKLSPKAHHIQNVLKGMAKASGGDCVSDLSRLLRLPGSYNRKNQRNGRTPVMTELLQCNPNQRYSFSDFEAFAQIVPTAGEATDLSKIILPPPRKPSTKQKGKFADLLNYCILATPGNRSEADFALCCFAIKAGMEKLSAWEEVKGVSKFAERGFSYFELTWSNAETACRLEIINKYNLQAVPACETDEGRDECEQVQHAKEGGHESAGGGQELPIIFIEEESSSVRTTLAAITDRMLESKECYTRSEKLVVIREGSIVFVNSASELAGLMNEYVEFVYQIVSEKSNKSEYKPLTANYANTWLKKHSELGRLPKIRLFTRMPTFTKDWRLVEPGYDVESGFYYSGKAIQALSGTTHLDELLSEFCFKTNGDRTNYIAMLLTGVLMSQFIGSKPAVLFNGNQPGLGKTILAQIISILRDGKRADTVTYNPNDEEFEKRLGAVVRSGSTTVIIDNAKLSRSRASIDSPCLERSITDSQLSFRLLGKSEQIRTENSLIFCITANSQEVSTDLATRCVVVNLEYEGDPRHRSFKQHDPESYALQYRAEIIGELLGMVNLWKDGGMQMANVNSRFNKQGWGKIVGGILEANNQLDFLRNTDSTFEQLDETRRGFSELVECMLENEKEFWTAGELVDLCASRQLLLVELGTKSQRSKSTKMGNICIRYVNTKFKVHGQEFIFIRSTQRQGSVYQILRISENANLLQNAEPLQDLESQ